MNTYPNLNNEPEMLKIKAKDDENRDFKYKTEKNDHEKVLKSLKIDNELYEKKCKSLNKRKVLLTTSEMMI